MQAVIDRFEGKKAVLRFSKGQEIVVSKKDLPKSCREGDILKLNFKLDRKKLHERKKEIQELLEEVYE